MRASDFKKDFERRLAAVEQAEWELEVALHDAQSEESSRRTKELLEEVERQEQLRSPLVEALERDRPARIKGIEECEAYLRILRAPLDGEWHTCIFKKFLAGKYSAMRVRLRGAGHCACSPYKKPLYRMQYHDHNVHPRRLQCDAGRINSICLACL